MVILIVFPVYVRCCFKLAVFIVFVPTLAWWRQDVWFILFIKTIIVQILSNHLNVSGHRMGALMCRAVLGHSVVSTLCDPRDCSAPGFSVHGDSPGRNTAVGCGAFLQGIFPTQESNQGFLLCGRILYHRSYQGSPNNACFYTKLSLVKADSSELHKDSVNCSKGRRWECSSPRFPYSAALPRRRFPVKSVTLSAR